MVTRRRGGKATGERVFKVHGAGGKAAGRDPARGPGAAREAMPRRSRGFEPAASALGRPLGEAAARYG
ncbi:MAG: hypothetical protein AAF899_17405, partial [Pseudomonadota bacterium]